ERVTHTELRLLVPERRDWRRTVERSEEIGLDRGSRRPLAEHRRGVEGEVETRVSDVAVEDPLVDAGLPRTSRYWNWAGGNLGVLPLPKRAEQAAVVEQGRADEAADGQRLSLPH